MGKAARMKKEAERNIAVYNIMESHHVYHFVMLSVMMDLCNKLAALNTCPVKLNRLDTIMSNLEKIEKSIPGFLPYNYMNRASKFVKMMHMDLESLLKDINAVKER